MCQKDTTYKLLNDIIFTNEKPLRFKTIVSSLWNFCKNLLFTAGGQKPFGRLLLLQLLGLESKTFLQTLTMMFILFSEFSESRDNIILNHMILWQNFIFNKSKLNNMEPSIKVFETKVEIVRDKEQ